MDGEIKTGNTEYMCEGCERLSPDFACLVYAAPPSYYIRHGCCPFNMPKRKATSKRRVRVGQQKQKKGI